MARIDGNLVSVLCVEDTATALVRVYSPWQMGYVARHFDVVAKFPFINSIGIRCNRKEVARLVGMREVECVCAQGKVDLLDDRAVSSSDAENDGFGAEKYGGEGNKFAEIFSEKAGFRVRA